VRANTPWCWPFKTRAELDFTGKSDIEGLGPLSYEA
jgi:hypothetical protein